MERKKTRYLLILEKLKALYTRPSLKKGPFSLSCSLNAKQILLFVSSLSFILTCIFSASFVTGFLDHFQKEKTLSSIEKNLPELTWLFQQQLETRSSVSSAENWQDYLASIPLLNYERGSLELIRKQRPLTEEEMRRWRFLTKENHLQFHTHRKSKNGPFQESEERLSHTVQIDENDLQAILEAIEGTSPRLPLRIKKITLEKIHNTPRYTLYLELWRKELS